MTALKTPPNNIDAEQCVLGGVMLGGAWHDVSGILKAADFYRPQHQDIFEAMAELVSYGQPVDGVMVADRLEAVGKLDRVGGQSYLIDLVESTPSAKNIAAYAQMVRDHALERSLIGVAQQIWDLGYGSDPTESKVNQAQSIVMSLALERRAASPRCMREVLQSVVSEVEERFASNGKVRGLSTGFPDLDHQWTGWKPGNVVVLAGRPAMGKTTLALNIAMHNVKQGKRVQIFSLEMSSEELIERAISSESGIAHRDIETGSFMGSQDGPPKFSQSVSNLKDLDLLIDDTGGIDLPRIRGRVRQACVERPVDLVIVDHLQLMSGEGRDENAKLTEITSGMKQLAKEIRCPVLLLSQLNREVDRRPYGKNRPVMADLRASGSIEQDADIVSFVYRNSVYKPKCNYSEVAEVITAKFRNGPIGTRYLRTDFAHCRFQSYAGDTPNYDMGRVYEGFNPEEFV